jgi:sRNA-binding regulator protein Hfq
MAERKAPELPTRSEEMAPTARKLIRPSLQEVKDRYPTRTFQRKQVPPEQTNAENYYYLKQMSAKTPMVVRLNDGEEIHGWIEWYDKGCLKLNREKGPNLLIPKHSIKYIYKENEADEKISPHYLFNEGNR